MKKSLLVALTLTMVLNLFLFTACGKPEGPVISEKRTVELSQLYNTETIQFSLGGYPPGMTSETLQNTDGFLQGEPIVFHGLAAKVRYSFIDDQLFQVTYEIASGKMSHTQWNTAASTIYKGLQTELGPFSDLVSYQSGTMNSNNGITSIWYANHNGNADENDGSNGMTMLAFSATPPIQGDGSNSPAGSVISVTVTSDLRAEVTSGQPSDFPDQNPVTVSYRSHFPPDDDEMVNVAEYVQGIFVDLMYARSDNFTGQVIYDFHNAYLRYGTVKKLIGVQKKLHRLGYSLKICDAFRPVEAQFKLWEIVPDPDFVADPYHGYSTHSRGNTVDLDLVTVDGTAVEMPTPVDTFSPLADRDYSDVSEAAALNALLLQNAMVEAGFKTSSVEWWHYYDMMSYPVAKDFYPAK